MTHTEMTIKKAKPIMNTKLTGTLSLHDYQVKIRLGHTEEERSKPQPVLIDLILQFIELPKACDTDELQDTICYDTLTKQITEFCIDKSFALLEHFAKDLYDFVNNQIKNEINLSLRIKKPHPIENLSYSAFIITNTKSSELPW
jgi:dihydroneopterin aldolase